MSTITSRIIFFSLTFILFSSACTSNPYQPSQVPIIPSETLSATLTPTLTATSTFTPFPTNTATPTITVTATPTVTSSPTFTSTPIISLSSLNTRFTAEISPLVSKLLSAQPPPTGINLSGQDPIFLIPQTSQLYSIQSAIFPNLTISTNPPRAIYILYQYTRGAPLSWTGPTGAGSSRVSAYEVIGESRLVLFENNRYYLLEKVSGTGGKGSSSLRELVTDAIRPLSQLSARSKIVQEQIQSVIGFACGLRIFPGRDFPNEASVLLFTLESSLWTDRFSAMQSLNELDPPPIVGTTTLLAHLTDPRPEVGSAARPILNKIAATGQAFDAFAKTLKHNDPEVRYFIVSALIKDPTHINETLVILDQLLQDPVLSVRKGVTFYLGEMNNPKAVPVLLHALKDTDPQVRSSSLKSLSKYPKDALPLLPELIILLSDKSPAIRGESANLIFALGSDASYALPALITAASGETYGTIFETQVKAIQLLGGQKEIPSLALRAIKAEDTRMRVLGCNFLAGQVNDPGALAALTLALNDKDFSVRLNAANALATFGSKARSSVPSLIQLLSDRNPAVIESGHKALVSITGTDQGIKTADWQTWWNKNK